jgi:hypothetical protein
MLNKTETGIAEEQPERDNLAKKNKKGNNSKFCLNLFVLLFLRKPTNFCGAKHKMINNIIYKYY